MPDPHYIAPVLMKEGAPAGNPPAGYLYVYADGGVYKQKNSAGVISNLVPITTLAGMPDTTIVTPTDGQILQFGGSSTFENVTQPAHPWPLANPTLISGCKLWIDFSDPSTVFDATSGGSNCTSTGALKRVEDKSGNGYDFTEGTNYPTWEAAGLNNLGALRFPIGGGKTLTHATNFMTGSSGGTMFGVIKYDSDPPAMGGHFLSFPTSTYYCIYSYSSDATWYEGFGLQSRVSTGDPSHNFTNTTIASVRADTGDFTIKFNGSTHYSNSGQTLGWTASSLWIGGAGNVSYSPTGMYIGEIITYDRPLTTLEMSSVQAYLTAKWI